MKFSLLVSVLFATALTLGAVLAQAAATPPHGFNFNATAASKSLGP